MAAALCFLIKIVRAPLSAVAAHSEENVHIARDQITNRAIDIDRPARRSEDRPAFLMNAIDNARRNLNRFHGARRIESTISAAETEHVGHAIAVM